MRECTPCYRPKVIWGICASLRHMATRHGYLSVSVQCTSNCKMIRGLLAGEWALGAAHMSDASIFCSQSNFNCSINCSIDGECEATRHSNQTPVYSRLTRKCRCASCTWIRRPSTATMPTPLHTHFRQSHSIHMRVKIIANIFSTLAMCVERVVNYARCEKSFILRKMNLCEWKMEDETTWHRLFDLLAANECVDR